MSDLIQQVIDGWRERFPDLVKHNTQMVDLATAARLVFLVENSLRRAMKRDESDPKYLTTFRDETHPNKAIHIDLTELARWYAVSYPDATAST